VARVNLLIQAYLQAHSPQGGRTLAALKQVVAMVVSRDFAEASVLLVPGLGEKDLRAHCWNVSSFLSDQEAQTMLKVQTEQ
jgi:hypothetical protein